MKTLKMFYLAIYWTQELHNDFIFLCSVSTAICWPLLNSINVEIYKTIELWFEFLSHFYGFQLTLPCSFLQCVVISFYSGSNIFLG